MDLIIIKKWLDKVWIITCDSLPVLLGIGVAIATRCPSFDTLYVWHEMSRVQLYPGRCPGPLPITSQLFPIPCHMRVIFSLLTNHKSAPSNPTIPHSTVIIIPSSNVSLVWPLGPSRCTSYEFCKSLNAKLQIKYRSEMASGSLAMNGWCYVQT